MAFSKFFMVLFVTFMTFASAASAAPAAPAAPVHESAEVQGLKEFHNLLLQMTTQRSVPSLPIPPGLIDCLANLINNGKCKLGGDKPSSSSGGDDKPCCGPSRRFVMPDGVVVRANSGVIEGSCKIC